MTTLFAWKRFWHNKGDEPRLTDNGLLYDRDNLVARMLGSKLVTLEELSNAPCLILLGEPGVGKSTEVEAAASTVAASLAPPHACMLVQLRDIDSRAAFRDKVELTSWFQAWLQGNHTLTLFLDSLDEGLLGFAALSSTIAEFLKPLPHERLRLRLVSRTADWPAELTHAIASLWGERARSLTLAPLREEDVTTAAVTSGEDASQFLDELSSRGVGPLAARPVTLRLLMAIFAADGALPTSRAALYDRGCGLLAMEESLSRKSARRVGTLDSRQRIAIAGRIAFVLMIANRSAVWVDNDDGAIPTSDVTLEDLLAPRRENANQANLSLSQADLIEVLHSGLFTLRGPSRFAFAHQTFAEHLASLYIAQHRPSWQQLRSFLFTRQGGQERIVPQLRETAARLAERAPGVLRRLAARDPVVMLKALDLGSGAQRAAMIDALLAQTRRDRVPASEGYSHDELGRLCHQGIASQLLPILCDHNEVPEARRFAADLAAACRPEALAEPLASIALDSSQQFLLRYDAMVALRLLDAADTNMLLIPLALGKDQADEYDQLKGMALQMVWPSATDAAQLFGGLHHPRRSSMYGPYQDFLVNLGETLSTTALPQALRWATHYATFDGHLRDCVTGILARASRDLDSPGVLEGFSPIAQSRLLAHRPIMADQRDDSLSFRRAVRLAFADLVTADDVRRRLVRALFDRTTDPREVFTLMHNEPTLVQAADMAWLTAQFATETDGARRAVWREAVLRLFLHSGDQHVLYEHVHAAALQDRELREALSDFVDGVELSSSRATELRRSFEEMRRWESSPRQRTGFPPRQEEVISFLQRFEEGDTDAWWKLCLYLARDAQGVTQDDFYLSIARQPGWSILDGITQERMTRAALHYLEVREPQLDQWVGTNNFYHPDASAMRALHLLASLGADHLPASDSPIWRRWCPALVAFTVYDNQDREIDKDLLARALRSSPDVVLAAIVELIKREDSVGHAPFVLSRLETLWTDIAPALIRMVRERALSASLTEHVLLDLLKSSSVGAEALAAELCVLPLPNSGSDLDYALAAIHAVMRSGSHSGVSHVWPAIVEDDAFGVELFLSLAANRDWLIPDILTKWGEQKVGELYIWLEEHFPAADDPQPEGVYSPSPRINIGHWRQQLVSALSNAGTWEAVEALEAIHRRYPGIAHAHLLRDARESAWRATWHPPSPVEALIAITRSQVRLVRNADELLHVINESLYRFQGALVGDTPVVRLLWHKRGQRCWRPADEGALADALALHLDADLRVRGIVAGREVVIRRGGDGVPGSRTDITVYAVVPGHDQDSYDTVSVIIEVKCSWNPSVDTALETQLVGDYLLHNQRTTHGVYVVGWFHSPVWDTTDGRRTMSARWSIHELLELVTRQARAARQAGHRVVAGVLDVSFQQNIARPKTRRRARRGERR